MQGSRIASNSLLHYIRMAVHYCEKELIVRNGLSGGIDYRSLNMAECVALKEQSKMNGQRGMKLHLSRCRRKARVFIRPSNPIAVVKNRHTYSHESRGRF